MTIIRGVTVVNAVVDLQGTRKSDLKWVKFQTVNPDISIDFGEGLINYSVGVDPYLKDCVNYILDNARVKKNLAGVLDNILTLLLIAGVVAGILYLPAPWYTISLPAYLVYLLSEHVWWIPRPTREFIFWCYLLSGLIFFEEDEGSVTEVKIVPYRRADLRQIVIQGHVAWATNLIGAIILLILTVPVTLLIAWLSKLLGLSN